MVRAKSVPCGQALSQNPKQLQATVPDPATTGGAQMVTKVVANDTDRPTHCSFPHQALLMAPEDLLDNLVGALRASVAHPDEAVQALAEATLGEVRGIQAGARRKLAAQRAELSARRIALIADHVCHALRVDRETIKGKSRVQHIAFCRQVAMFICRQLSAASFPSFGALFDRDHTTVIAACQVIEQRMSRDSAFRIFIEQLEDQITGTVPTTTVAAA